MIHKPGYSLGANIHAILPEIPHFTHLKGTAVQHLPMSNILLKQTEFDRWARKTPGEGNFNPLTVLTWEIPWTEEPDGQQTVHGFTKELDTT